MKRIEGRRSRSSIGRKHYVTLRKPIGAEESQRIGSIIKEAYRFPGGPNSLDEAKEYWRKEKVKLDEERQGRIYNRHTYNSRLNSAWKTERLYVAEDTHLPGKSITEDLDPEFFKIVSCRPIKQGQKISEYLRDVRECFLTRLKTGYCLDEILLAEVRQAREKRQLEEVNRQFLSYSKGFEDFLRDDYLAGAKLLEMAEEETDKSKNKLEMAVRLRSELKEVEMEISELEEKWRKCKTLQKFLYLTAPSEWRKVNDPDYGSDRPEGTVSDPCLLDRYRELPEESIKVNLEMRISQFRKDIEECRTPVLYQTDPKQILDVLSELEKNNLRALIQCNEMEFPASEAIREVEKVKTRFECDQARVEEEISLFEEAAREEEEKWSRNEESLREIAFGIFRNLIANLKYLNVIAFLEDAYEDAVTQADSHTEPLAMMKQIEMEYERVMLELDGMPREIVKKTKVRFFEEEKRKMAEAKEAERRARQMERLLKRLSESLRSPEKVSKGRKAVSGTEPQSKVSIRRKPSRNHVIEEEEMDRFFFSERTSETTKLYRPLCA